jgi:hypothetical protein
MMDTAYQSYKILSAIGKSPFEGDNEVGGEETDSVVTRFTLRFFGIVAIAAIASGGEKKWRRMMMGSSILESFVR